MTTTKTMRKKVDKLRDRYFPPNYGYKMGGTHTINITLKGKTVFTAEYDEREYYSGTGAKYNSGINHDVVTIDISLNRLNSFNKDRNARNKKLADKKTARDLGVEKYGAYVKVAENGFIVTDIENEKLMLKTVAEKLGVDLNDLSVAFDKSRNSSCKCNIRIDDGHAIYHPDFSINGEYYLIDRSLTEQYYA